MLEYFRESLYIFLLVESLYPFFINTTSRLRVNLYGQPFRCTPRSIYVIVRGLRQRESGSKGPGTWQTTTVL